VLLASEGAEVGDSVLGNGGCKMGARVDVLGSTGTTGLDIPIPGPSPVATLVTVIGGCVRTTSTSSRSTFALSFFNTAGAKPLTSSVEDDVAVGSDGGAPADAAASNANKTANNRAAILDPDRARPRA
jgi:hypothetical protein